MPTTDKLKSLKDTGATKKFIDDAWSLWGTMQDTTKQQGWYPTVKDPKTNVVTFRSSYDAPFNTVVIPGEKEHGYIEIEGNPDKTFNLVTRKADGSTDRYLYQNANANTIQEWMTKSGSDVAQRQQHLPDTQKFAVK